MQTPSPSQPSGSRGPDLRTIQRDAAEQAVIANLAAKGLIDSEPAPAVAQSANMPSMVGSTSHPLWQYDNQKQPAALAKSAQSAIETVAFHYPKAAPSISISYPDQAWFHADAFHGSYGTFKVCQSRAGLSLITNYYPGGSSFRADVQITPAQARSISAMLLNAADFAEANPHFGKVAA